MTPRKNKTNTIYLAEEQLQHIEGLLNSALLTNGRTPEFVLRLRALKQELDKARVVPLDQIGPDVVRVGSWVELEDRTDGYVDQYQLVYPEHADLSLGRISLMTPMGIALLGEQAGREVRFQAPSGEHKVLIRRVSAQPFTLEPSSPQAGRE